MTLSRDGSRIGRALRRRFETSSNSLGMCQMRKHANARRQPFLEMALPYLIPIARCSRINPAQDDFKSRVGESRSMGVGEPT